VKKYIKFEEGDKRAWGKATATVHASKEVVLAWLFFYCSNHRVKQHEKREKNPSMIRRYYNPDNDNTSQQQQEATTNHTQHVVIRKHIAPGFDIRESNIKTAWGMLNESMVLGFEPADAKFVGGPATKRKKRKTMGSKVVPSSMSSMNVSNR